MFIRTDYDKLKSDRFGNGTFGMKTTEPDRFSVLLDRHQVGRLPGVAFSIDTFGNNAGKKGYRVGDTTTALLVDELRKFAGFGLVLRADERTAKGVGLPGGTHLTCGPAKLRCECRRRLSGIRPQLRLEKELDWKMASASF